MHADQVVRAVARLVEQPAQQRGEVLVVAADEVVVRGEQYPRGQRDGQGVEVGEVGQLGEVLAPVGGRVVPAAVRVPVLRRALDRQLPIRLVELAVRA